MRVTSRTGSARRILGILKKSGCWVLPREKTVGFRLLAEARPVALWRVPHVLGAGADEKARIERMSISLPYVEAFNSKIIKGFVPDLRSRYVFFVFRDSYVLCIYLMNIRCTFHISVSWVWYISWSISFVHEPVKWEKYGYLACYNNIYIYIYISYFQLPFMAIAQTVFPCS